METQALLAPDTYFDPIQDSSSTIAMLRQWRDSGWIRPLDCAFAEFLYQEQPNTAPLVLLASALVSHQSASGHLLLDLKAVLSQPEAVISVVESNDAGFATTLKTPELLLREVNIDQWVAALSSSELVQPASHVTMERRPLVLDGHCLYLRRYWRYERDITRGIDAMVSRDRQINEDHMRQLLSQLFPDDSTTPPPDWQMLACAIAARSHFGVITGGPGTGKTTTVVKLLALLQALSMKTDGLPLRIRLAAPTGKAAARLNESIASQVTELPLHRLDNGEEVRAVVPTEVTTLHRLLGARPNTRKFLHHKLNPLPVDLVVVDEASMIDVEMTANLLDALPPHAGMILLGDKDQLASVEAGAILGSICAQAHDGHYSAETSDWLERVTGKSPSDELFCSPARPLDQAIAMLRHSYRFGSHSGIGQLARAINNSQPDMVRGLLDDPTFADLHTQPLSQWDDRRLDTLSITGVPGRGHGYSHFLTLLRDHRPAATEPQEAFDCWAHDVLASHSQFQLLCALRKGPLGVEEINPRIERCLANAGYLPAEAATGSIWYEGRPVMMTGNDYGLKLMNGDIGISLSVPVGVDSAGQPLMALRVAFPAGDGAGIRWVLPSRLQRVETVFAMTVHKSQGSEFAHAALVLPDTLTPIVTRELFYTAVTRAKELFSLVEVDKNITTHAVNARIRRASRLFVPGSMQVKS